jgi:hypothetical protein
MPQSISWKRLAAEGSAIVVSILLAFAIDAAWEARVDRLESRAAVASLRTDFAEARAALTRNRQGNESVLAAIDTVLRLVGEGVAVVEVPTRLLVRITVAPTYDPPTGSLDGLVASGRLGMLTDQPLQEALAAWPAAVDDMNDKSRLHESFVYDELIPEMRGIMPFRILANTRWAEADRPETLPVRSTEEFLALLGHLSLMPQRTLNSAGGMRKVDRLLSQIEERLFPGG